MPKDIKDDSKIKAREARIDRILEQLSNIGPDNHVAIAALLGEISVELGKISKVTNISTDRIKDRIDRAVSTQDDMRVQQQQDKDSKINSTSVASTGTVDLSSLVTEEQSRKESINDVLANVILDLADTVGEVAVDSVAGVLAVVEQGLTEIADSKSKEENKEEHVQGSVDVPEKEKDKLVNLGGGTVPDLKPNDVLSQTNIDRTNVKSPSVAEGNDAAEAVYEANLAKFMQSIQERKPNDIVSNPSVSVGEVKKLKMNLDALDLAGVDRSNDKSASVSEARKAKPRLDYLDLAIANVNLVQNVLSPEGRDTLQKKPKSGRDAAAEGDAAKNMHEGKASPVPGYVAPTAAHQTFSVDNSRPR